MRRAAKWMVRGGLAVWGFGIVAAISGVWVTLPPDATKWLVLGLATTSGGLLVVWGMAIGRGARRSGLPAASAPREISAGVVESARMAQATREKAKGA